jgi:hypothetical protein
MQTVCIDVQIPCNAEAYVTLQPPKYSSKFIRKSDSTTFTITESGVPIERVNYIRATSASYTYAVPSGNYHFCISA